MAYEWYYKDGDDVPVIAFPGTPTTTIKSQPNGNLRGNMIHLDVVNGITNAGHPDNPGVEENGSENFPFSNIQEALNQMDTSAKTILLIAPTAIYDISSELTITSTSFRFTSDRKYVVFENIGSSTNRLLNASTSNGFYGCIFNGFDGGISNGASAHATAYCIVNQKQHYPSFVGSYPSWFSIYYMQSGSDSKISGLYDNCVYVNIQVYVQNTSGKTQLSGTRGKAIVINSYLSFEQDYTVLDLYFDGGSIKVGSRTAYNIDAAIAGGKTEAQIIADIEDEFDAEYGGSHTFSNLRIAVPGESELPFINKTKGNYLFDATNSDSETLYNAGYGIGVGYGLDFDSTEADSDFVNSITSPHYSASDGFSGELYCRNLDSNGQQDNSANDAVWVSKKITLPELGNLAEVNFLGLLNELDIGDQGDLELYIAQSIGDSLENVFNSTDYTFSYSGGVLTIDFPRFNLGDAAQQINRLTDGILDQIEKGSYNKDTGRILYSNSGIEFRFIIVKRGV